MGLFDDDYEEEKRLFPRSTSSEMFVRPDDKTEAMKSGAGRPDGFFTNSGNKLSYNRPSSRRDDVDLSGYARRGEWPGFPSIGTGTDYGTVGGRGAAGARFFGEGRVNLKQGGSSVYCQWQCSWYKSQPNLQNPDKIKVNLGLINGVVPTPTDGLIAASPGGNKFVILTCTTDGKAVTAAALSVTSTMPTPETSTAETAPSSFKYPIAVTNDSSIAMLVGCGPITVNVRPSITEDSTSYTAGQRNYIIYYNWY